MHAHPIVQRFLDRHVPLMHGARRRVLAAVTAAVMGGHWVGLSHLGRALAGWGTVKAAIKRVDRLIGHERIGEEACQIGAALLAQAARMSSTLVIAVDWSSASPGGAYVELRAAVTWPGAGRSLPVYQEVHPLKRLGDARAERALLERLHGWIGAQTTVIVITDAGFRRPWFEAVEALGWHYIGRVRRGVCLSDDGQVWETAGQWMARAGAKARRMGGCFLARRAPLSCDVVLYRRALQGRTSYGAQGRPTSHKAAREARVREREPWLLVHSPALAWLLRPDEIVALYARRMQIEESFRDSKSLCFGLGFSIGRSRSAARLQALLVVATLAAFLLWHIGQLAEAEGLHRRFKLTTRATREISLITLALLLCQSTHPPLTPAATQALRLRLAI